MCTGKDKDYTTGCLLNYQYYKNHYLLDADLRSIQELQCVFMLSTDSQILTILEKTKETILEFYKGTTKVS